MTGKLALAAIILAAVSLILLILTRPHHNQTGQASRPARHPAARASRFASNLTARPSSPTPATVTAPNAEHLLPFTPTQITDAGQLALKFTAAYSSYRYDEPPRRYVARLTPMMSTQLRPSIDRAAADPTILDQRHRQHEASTGTAHAETIRTLGPSSITFIVTATTHITGDYASRTETTRYAVTTIRHGDGWLIYAIELATTGDTGDRDQHGDGP